MNEELVAKIRTRMAELPEDVRNAIQSSDLEDKIRKIGQKHQLHIDQMAALSQETYLTMLAFAQPDHFVDNIVEQVRIPRPKAEEVANDVNNEIFLSIRESMKQFAEEQALLNATPVPPPVPSPAPITAAPTSKPPLASVLPNSNTPPAQQPITPPATAPTPKAPLTIGPTTLVGTAQAPATTPVPLKPAVPQTAINADLHTANVMLNEKTVEVAPKPQPVYKKDPYREPPE